MWGLFYFLLRSLEYNGSGTKRYYCAVFNTRALSVAQNAVVKECTGQAGEVS